MLSSNTSGLVKDKHARLLKPVKCTPLIGKQKAAVSFMLLLNVELEVQYLSLFDYILLMEINNCPTRRPESLAWTLLAFVHHAENL
jgi:hypothetical protein